MATPVHMRFTFRGDFVGTPEQFSFGLHFSRDNGQNPDAGVDDIVQSDVTEALRTFWNGGGSGVPTGCHITDWRAYAIGPDGLTEGNPLIVDLSADTISGGVSPKYPPQIACAVTTVALNRGHAKLGRFYLPTAAALGSDRRMSDTTCGEIAEASTIFIKSVSDAIDLVSTDSSEGLNISRVGAGTRQSIDHLEVGRVLDTLRNRRKSMLEERHVHGHIDW